MWPRTLILRDADPQAKKSDFSPYMAVSTYTQILVCFFIVGFCCLAAIVGYYTKISNICSLVAYSWLRSGIVVYNKLAIHFTGCYCFG